MYTQLLEYLCDRHCLWAEHVRSILMTRHWFILFGKMEQKCVSPLILVGMPIVERPTKKSQGAMLRKYIFV